MQGAMTDATKQIIQLSQYGALGIVAAVGLVFLVYVAYSCSKSTKVSLDKNTSVLQEIKLVLQERK